MAGRVLTLPGAPQPDETSLIVEAMREANARMLVTITLYNDNTLEYELEHDPARFNGGSPPLGAWLAVLKAASQLIENTAIVAATPKEPTDET